MNPSANNEGEGITDLDICPGCLKETELCVVQITEIRTFLDNRITPPVAIQVPMQVEIKLCLMCLNEQAKKVDDARDRLNRRIIKPGT